MEREECSAASAALASAEHICRQANAIRLRSVFCVKQDRGESQRSLER